MDMIQNSDNEENRQEVVDLLSVSMNAMLMAAYRWKVASDMVLTGLKLML